MKFNQLTSKQQLRALWIGAAILLVLAWTLSYSKTWDLYFENKELNAQLTKAETAPMQVAKLKNQLKLLSHKLKQYTADSITHQQEVMDAVSEFCAKNKLTLRSIPVRSYSSEKDFQIETMEITVEGNFHSLVKLLYFLEIENQNGRVASSQFHTFLDHQRKKQVLQLTVYLQTIQLNTP